MSQDNINNLTREMPFADADAAYVDSLVERATRRAIDGAAARRSARRRTLRRRWAVAAAAAAVALVVTLAVFVTGRNAGNIADSGALLAASTSADSVRDEFGFATIDYTADDSATLAAETATAAADPGPIDKFINNLDEADAEMLATYAARFGDEYDIDDNYI